MFYRIAGIIFSSQLRFSSFDSFACGPCDNPDAVLEITEELPPDGEEIETPQMVFRKVRDGWFLHSKSNIRSGLFVSKDYTRMRILRRSHREAGLFQPPAAENPKDAGSTETSELPGGQLRRMGLRTDSPGAVCGETREAGEQATYLEKQYIKIALDCLLARRGYVSLHAACFSLNGEAIALTGKSGMGKSTRAQAWQEAFRASLISGDRPLIHWGTNLRRPPAAEDAKEAGPNETGEPSGGQPRRLSPQAGSAGTLSEDRFPNEAHPVPEAYGVPWDGKEGCYRNVRYPLRAICEVRRSDTVYIRKLSAGQKRRLLLQQCFMPMWDTETAAIQMMNITRLASGIRIVRVFCGPTADDAKAVQQLLDSNQLRKEEPDMKAKDGFILREIAGEYILFPVGDNINQFNGAVLMNEISAFIWKNLQDPVSRGDLLTAIMDRYEVSEEKAAADLDALLNKLRENGMIAP